VKLINGSIIVFKKHIQNKIALRQSTLYSLKTQSIARGENKCQNLLTQLPIQTPKKKT